MYAAIRCYDPTVPPATVLEYSPESGRSIRQTYRVLIRELDLPTPPPDPLEYVDRIADAMDCDSTVRERAVEVIGAVKERTRNRALHPAGMAAACLYAAADEHGITLDQGELAQEVGASIETVNAIHREEVKAALGRTDS